MSPITEPDVFFFLFFFYDLAFCSKTHSEENWASGVLNMFFSHFLMMMDKHEEH